MAENAYPFYGVETNETQFANWASLLAGSGIATGLAVTAGSGMSVNVAAGTALIRGVYYENTATKNLAIEAAPASGTRTDGVVLRLDQTANTVTAVVKSGSTAVTQNDTTWEVLIATVAVSAGTAAITSGMITLRKPRIGLRVFDYTNVADRPAGVSGIPALAINTSTKMIDLWNGSAWSNLLDAANLSGVVPLSKGGTGATTRVAALNALGIFPQSTDPGHSAGRIWIKTPLRR